MIASVSLWSYLNFKKTERKPWSALAKGTKTKLKSTRCWIRIHCWKPLSVPPDSAHFTICAQGLLATNHTETTDTERCQPLNYEDCIPETLQSWTIRRRDSQSQSTTARWVVIQTSVTRVMIDQVGLVLRTSNGHMIRKVCVSHAVATDALQGVSMEDMGPKDQDNQLLQYVIRIQDMLLLEPLESPGRLNWGTVDYLRIPAPSPVKGAQKET